LVRCFWHDIPNHFPDVKLGSFVVMPNHVHGIIIIDKPYDDVNINNDNTTITTTKTIGQKRFQNQGKNTLSSIVGSFKSVVTKNARLIHANFAWQSRFHDHIIRDDKSFNTISNYIQNNPMKWGNDRFNGLG
jgi:putative transposase